MGITLLDGILIVIMLISALLAMVRGFVRETLSIVGWVAAVIAAVIFYEDLLPYVQEHIAHKQIAIAVSAGAIFLLVLMIVGFITIRISDFVLDSRIGVLDRTLGFVFGAARGLLLVLVATLFFNWFLPDKNAQPTWITSAKSKPILDLMGEQLMGFLPEDPERAILEQFQNPIFNGSPAPSVEGSEAEGGTAVPPPASGAGGDAPQNQQQDGTPADPLAPLIQSNGGAGQ